MKKIIFTQFVAVMLLINIFVTNSFAMTDVGEAIKILPESTDFVIKFSSTKNFYQYFSVTEESIFGEPIDDLNEIKDILGFNPFNLKELEEKGIDGSKPVAIAVSDFKIISDKDEPNMNFMILLPVKDVDKAVAAIKEIVEIDNPDANFTKQGELWSWQFEIATNEPEDLEDEALGKDTSEEDATQPDQSTQAQAQTKEANEIETSTGDATPPVETPPMATYMVNKNGYLIIGANPNEDAKVFFEQLGKAKTNLAASPIFTKVADKVNPSNDIFIYLNLGKIFNSNPEAIKYLSDAGASSSNGDKKGNSKDDSYLKSLNYLKDYQGMGLSADLKSPDLKANFVVNVAPDSPLLNIFKGVTPKRDTLLGLKENPLLLIGVVENFQAYWKIVKEAIDSDNEINKEFATIKAQYDIDVENDIIQNIGNNIGLGIYDAMSINMANVNTLVTIEFKEPAKVKAAIEKGIAKLSPEEQSMINRVPVNGSEVFMVQAGPVQVYSGFIGDDFTIALGKPMFEKAMSAELENGFMKSVTDSHLKSSFQKDLSIFFFDVGEAMYALKNFAPMLISVEPQAQIITQPKFKEIVEPLDYILSTFSGIEDGNSMVGELKFKTKFNKPFFQGLKDVIDQIDALSKTAKK
ncbi:MAG: hypothetical protein HQK74_00845 [Desulfamplus sp.]|nr:hypothetical protein [Desulfamplus sp.]